LRAGPSPLGRALERSFRPWSFLDFALPVPVFSRFQSQIFFFLTEACLCIIYSRPRYFLNFVLSVSIPRMPLNLPGTPSVLDFLVPLSRLDTLTLALVQFCSAAS
jgi:hypothetical protein